MNNCLNHTEDGHYYNGDRKAESIINIPEVQKYDCNM